MTMSVDEFGQQMKRAFDAISKLKKQFRRLRVRIFANPDGLVFMANAPARSNEELRGGQIRKFAWDRLSELPADLDALIRDMVAAIPPAVLVPDDHVGRLELTRGGVFKVTANHELNLVELSYRRAGEDYGERMQFTAEWAQQVGDWLLQGAARARGEEASAEEREELARRRHPESIADIERRAPIGCGAELPALGEPIHPENRMAARPDVGGA